MKKWLLLLALLPSWSFGYSVLHVSHGPWITSAGVTQYDPVGNTDLEFNYTTEPQAQTPYNTAGVMVRMTAYITSNGLTNGATVYLRINGANANEHIYIPPSGSVNYELQDIMNADNIHAGDLVDYQLVTQPGGSNITIWGVGIVFAANTNTMMEMVAEGQPGITMGSNGFASYYEAVSGTLGFDQTETNGEALISNVAGTYANMCVYVTQNSLNITQTMRFRKNFSNGNEVITISPDATGLFCDTTHTDSVVIGDTVDYNYNMGGTANAGSTGVSFMKSEFTTTGTSMTYVTQNTGHTPAIGSTQYGVVLGASSWTTPEIQYSILAQVGGTLSGLAMHIPANSQTSNVPVHFRNNAANGSQQLDIPAGGTGYFVAKSSESDTITPLSQINDSVTTTGSNNWTCDWTEMVFNQSVSPNPVNLVQFWAEDGGYKMSQQDTVPISGTSMISRQWDGHSINLFGGKGELLTGVLYAIDGTANDAINVTATLAPFLNSSNVPVITSTPVAASNTWDYTTRPYSLYKYNYTQIVGFDVNGPSWDPTEYEERQVPTRFQVPCTVNGNNDCIPNSPTWTWLNRQDQNKFYPDAAVPIEEYPSGFTVPKSSSQAIGYEIYISTNLVPGNYTSTLTVYEGAAVSTSIPINLIVYNVTLPPTATVPVIGYVQPADINLRINGTEFPGNQYVNPYLTSKLRIAAFLHRHKVIAVGDQPATTQDFPSVEYAAHLNGSAYTPTYGFGNGPGQGVGDNLYMIGTYGAWASTNWSTSTVTGTNGFCTNISSWTSYCNTNGVTCNIYTYNDEASTPFQLLQSNILSTWVSTATACIPASGPRIGYFQTGDLPTLVSSAPYANVVASTQWSIAASSTVWQRLETQYQTQVSTTVQGTQTWGYNSGINTPTMFSGMEMGLDPRALMWSMFKTNQAGWFLWNTTQWVDNNNGGQPQNGWNANSTGNNSLYLLSKTYGYDNFPTTSTVYGHSGSAFTNRDGNLIYPGTDTVYPAQSFGVNGAFGSWRLNMLTRGIQDVDLFKMAYKINSAAALTLVNSAIQNVMWYTQCFDPSTPANCSYSYGPKQWSENPNLYETIRESLEQLIANSSGGGTSFSVAKIQGTSKVRGNARLQ